MQHDEYQKFLNRRGMKRILYGLESTANKTHGIIHESNAVRHLQILHEIMLLLP